MTVDWLDRFRPQRSENTDLKNPDLDAIMLWADNWQGASKVREREIGDAVSQQAVFSKKELSSSQKTAFGSWLKTNFANLLNQVPDSNQGITIDDIKNAYTTSKWADGKRISPTDMQMLKATARNFDYLAISGTQGSQIETEDVDDLLAGAKAKRTATDGLVVTYPDGTVKKRNTVIDRSIEKPDGSLSIESRDVTINLDNKTNTGKLILGKEMMKASGAESVEIALKREADGSWWGATADGSELQLAIDKGSMLLRMSDLEIVMSGSGGHMRDPSNPTFEPMFINRDGSVTMYENGKSAEIARSPQGVLSAQGSDGSLEVMYPINEFMYIRDSQSNINISGMKGVPAVYLSTDGNVRVTEPGGNQLNSTCAKDTGCTVTTGNGVMIMVDKDRTVSYLVGSPGQALKISFATDGTLAFASSSGQKREIKTPVLRRPK